MNEKGVPNIQTVPYIVHESTLAREERKFKRLITVLIILIIAFFATNAFWIYEFTRYDYSDSFINVKSEDTGNANYIGNDGDINNGSSNGD